MHACLHRGEEVTDEVMDACSIVFDEAENTRKALLSLCSADAQASSRGSMRKRQERQEAVRRIVRAERVRTQRALVDRLKEAGFDCTQATVSRDITEMGLRKLPEGVYVLAEDLHLQRMVRDLVKDVARSGNLVLVKAQAGTAPGVAAALDAAELDGILGSVSGDDTILVVMESDEGRAADVETLSKFQRRLGASRRRKLTTRTRDSAATGRNSMAREKCVLAYSGGLDTSVAIKWITENHDLDVVALAIDVGQERQDLEYVRQKALTIGAVESIVKDVREEYVEEFLSKALKSNALYENKYPLLSAMSRPIIVKHLVVEAHRCRAKYIAHGCTGKGNDQVRFEVGVAALDPDLEVIAPVREWDLCTREMEMDWAEERDIPVPTTKDNPYSIDDNLWGRAIECGVLEDPWVEPPADIYTLTNDARTDACGKEPEYAEISFEQGVPVALNGELMTFHEIINRMNELAGKHGFGRIDMIENRLIGVKSREIYEVPGALTLITAHKALEDLCLEREVLHYKLGVEQKWAELVYNGMWFSPLKEALDGFIETTQQLVTGDVRLRFFRAAAFRWRRSVLAVRLRPCNLRCRYTFNHKAKSSSAAGCP
jgi:argininosuccinate synthase